MPPTSPESACSPEPFEAYTAALGNGQNPPDRRANSPMKAYGILERAFAASGLLGAAGCAAGAVMRARGYGWAPVLGLSSGVLLFCALAGIWAQNHVMQFQRGELALVYATALHGPRRASFDRRRLQPSWAESIGMTFGDLIDTIRLTVLGRDRFKRWGMDMRKALSERGPCAAALAVTLGEDAHAIALAMNATRRSEADIAAEFGVLSQHAGQAAGATSFMLDEIKALEQAIRLVTAHAENAATEAASLADTAFAAQRGVASVGEVTVSLVSAADQVRAVLQRADMLGINAGIEAARAGEAGRGFAVVASEIKNLATNAQSALDAMLQIVGGLKKEAAEMRVTIAAMGDAVHTQTRLGQALAEAASHQVEAIGRVAKHVGAAAAEITVLRDRTNAFENRDFGLGAHSAARKAVERLPAHAEAVAAILRGLPEFVETED
jgi:methyl-accepting chemotaxis protein